MELDPGGGEAQLTASRDVAMERPVVQPTSQLVGVSAMSVDVTWRRRDRILSTFSDRVMVVMEDLQWDCWIRSGSDPSRRGESAVNVGSAVGFVGGQVSAFLSGTDGCADFAGEVAIVVTLPAVLASDVDVEVALLRMLLLM